MKMLKKEKKEVLLQRLSDLEADIVELRALLEDKKKPKRSNVKKSKDAKAKNNERKVKVKGKRIKKSDVPKVTRRIVKKLEQWGYKVVNREKKSTWHILNTDGEKVGVVKPQIGKVEKLKYSEDEGTYYKRVKVSSFRPKN